MCVCVCARASILILIIVGQKDGEVVGQLGIYASHTVTGKPLTFVGLCHGPFDQTVRNFRCLSILAEDGH